MKRQPERRRIDWLELRRTNESGRSWQQKGRGIELQQGRHWNTHTWFVSHTYVRSTVHRHSTNVDKYCITSWQILTKTDLFQKGFFKKPQGLWQAWNIVNIGWGYQNILKSLNIDHYIIFLSSLALYRALYWPVYCPFLGWMSEHLLHEKKELVQCLKVQPSGPILVPP